MKLGSYGEEDRLRHDLYSEIHLSGTEKADAHRAFALQQAELKSAEDQARARGDTAATFDANARRHLAHVERHAGLANDNANRAVERGDDEERERCIAERDQLLEKAETIRTKHEEFRATAEERTGRLFNHIDEPRGEDLERKAVWESRQKQQQQADPKQERPEWVGKRRGWDSEESQQKAQQPQEAYKPRPAGFGEKAERIRADFQKQKEEMLRKSKEQTQRPPTR